MDEECQDILPTCTAEILSETKVFPLIVHLRKDVEMRLIYWIFPIPGRPNKAYRKA